MKKWLSGVSALSKGRSISAAMIEQMWGATIELRTLPQGVTNAHIVWVDEWVDGWMNGWVDKYMNGWVGESLGEQDYKQSFVMSLLINEKSSKRRSTGVAKAEDCGV